MKLVDGYRESLCEQITTLGSALQARAAGELPVMLQVQENMDTIRRITFEGSVAGHLVVKELFMPRHPHIPIEKKSHQFSWSDAWNAKGTTTNELAKHAEPEPVSIRKARQIRRLMRTATASL